MNPRLTRRRFLAAAIGTGATLSLPLELVRRLPAVASDAPATYYFAAGSPRLATLQALCSRIVPTDTDPVTAAVTSPGAADAGAYLFIDRLLAAFALPVDVADNPAIYLRGPYSGRNPLPDESTGTPSSQYPPDSFLTGTQGHYLPLGPLQQLSWQAGIEGTTRALAAAPSWVSSGWRQQVASGAQPAPPAGGLQQLYEAGLDGFESYSTTLFGVPFAEASPTEQDLMIETAGNVVVGQLPVAPDTARALFPVLVVNTFQGTYGLPEYRGRTATPIWTDIGWDGDTQPLGSSIYDAGATAPPPGQMPNTGFGDPSVYQPVGYYNELPGRPVSTLDPAAPALAGSDLAPWVAALSARGVFRQIGVQP